MIDPSTLARARTLLIKLELVSHGRTANLSPEPGRSAEVTALFPPGGIARKDDRDDPESPLWQARSHLHFKPRLAGARSTETVELLIREMEAALRAWTHTAMPPVDSPAMRDQIVADTRHVSEIAQDWGITARRVYQIKQAARRAA